MKYVLLLAALLSCSDNEISIPDYRNVVRAAQVCNNVDQVITLCAIKNGYTVSFGYDPHECIKLDPGECGWVLRNPLVVSARGEEPTQGNVWQVYVYPEDQITTDQ